MTTFLKRLWATLTALPTILTGVAAVAPFASQAIANALPSGPASEVVRYGAVLAIWATAGSTIVTRVTPVAKALRGFPTASLSEKEVLLQQVADLELQLKQAVAAAKAAAELAATPPPPPAVDLAPWREAAGVPADHLDPPEVSA